ncbi:MAG: PKD domain-containing protein [Bacteroidota bacterium]|nr:PKD domain-containing protein [Bacteroidota bacterium]MDX5430758.1 PKD domain-containing protein [Bacteroidota bacterium]MDX5469503.1 PKD domain-containing protein [Bacteroidota bacterium]
MVLASAWAQGQTFLINENFDNFPSTNPALPNQGWSNNIITGVNSDQWLFSNPGGRNAASPISGKFAIFDSDWYSNGGGAEDVALESPSFSTVGFKQVRLKFDQYFDGIYNNGDSIVVEVYDGSSWSVVYSSQSFASFSSSEDLNVTAQLTNKANAKIRFRFVGDWSFYWIVDNVQVLGLMDYDGRALQASFASGICGDASDSVLVDVTNAGIQNLSNFTVSANLTGTLGGNAVNQTVSATYTGTLTPGQKGSITLPPFNTAQGGSVVLSAWTAVSNEENAANDTVTNSLVNFIGTPNPPTVANMDRCGEGSVTFTATGIGSADTVVWYDDPNTIVPLGTGVNFETPVMGPGNYTYYVSAGRGALTGSLTSTFQGGNGQAGVMFDVTANRTLIIDSFEVSIDAGTHLVEVYYKAGTYVGFEANAGAWTLLGTTTVTSSQAQGGPGLFVNVGNTVTIPAGAKYAFYIQTPNATAVNYTTLGSITNWSNSEMTITAGAGKGVNFGATFTPRGFNGSVRYSYFPLCEGSRATVSVEVKPLPTGSIVAQGTPFQGTFNSGTQLNPDVVAEGDSISLEITEPTGYNNSDFGSTWIISDIQFATVNGTAVPSGDTSTFAPSANSNGSILFVPSVANADSLFRITATITSLTTGCDTVIHRYVYVAPRPNASFTYVPTCDGSDMQFVNNSSIINGLMSYEWTFLPSQGSTLENPSFKFPASGMYDVVLKVTSDYGYVDYDTQTVEVKPVPQTTFNALNACEGNALQFTNTTLMPPGNATYTWDFGDGNSDNQQNTSHMYGTPGFYTVTYTIEVNGCSKSVSKGVTQAPRAKVDFSHVAICNNTEVDFTNNSTLTFGTMGYSWDFGDNMNGTEKDPKHDYVGFGTFDVKLKAYTDLGCVDSFSATVNVIQAPEINISFTNPCAGEGIQFTNNSAVPAGFNNSYDWHFGDGSSSTDSDPSHTYPGVGTYNLILRSFSTNGCADSLFLPITINEKPNAAVVLPSVVCDGDEVKFLNATTSAKPNQMSYFWNFGNSQTSQVKDTAFVFNGAGTYNVTMVAVIAGGCSDTATKAVRVSALPSAGFTAVSAQTMDGTMQFVADATGAGVTYQWFFGDGGKATTANPTHRYVLDGNYTVKLFTKNADNCMNESQQVINILRTNLTGIDLDATLSLYPNPNKGQFVVELEGADFADVSLSVVNALGQQIVFESSAIQSNQTSLNLLDASKGVYYLNLTHKNGAQSTLRFVIQ